MAPAAAQALQLFHRFPNIVERYVIRKIGNTDTWCDNEPDFSTFEFLIELYGLENLPTRKILRQTRGQRQSSEKINNRGALIRPQPSSFHRDRARGDNSKAHCFSMQKFPVISGPLDRVTNCMAEIQKRPLARPVLLVFGNDARFDLDVAFDQPL